MRIVFLSFHFDEVDENLARQVEGLITSHGLRMQTGEVLGGGALTPEVMGRIEKSDALIALMTKRAGPPDYGGTHPWVVEEFKYAKSLGRPAISLVWPGVQVGGAYADSERIDYDVTNGLKSFLKLSQIIGIWKINAGRMLKVQLFPPALADGVAAASGGAQCRYRFYDEGAASPWIDAISVPEGDGTYIYLKGVRAEARIQLRVEVGGKIWESKVLAQSMSVELQQK
ncbi:MAG: hypothetical protein QOD12_1269 [Verrucomicrobiota bacterium]